MAERKQKLIHLHSAEALSVAKANAVNMAVGEIAVQAAAEKKDSSLWILTSDKANVVQFPSVEKVQSLISGATSGNISTLRNEVDELKGTVSGYNSTNTVKAAIDGVKNDLQGKINTINGLIGSGFTSDSTIADQLSAVKTTADGANTQATTNKNSIDTINSVLKGLSGESAVSNAINKAKTKVVATDTATTKFLTVSDNSATNPASGVTYTLTLTDVASASKLSGLSTKVGTNETDITALKALHADNKDKSGKLTVAQEVAAGIAGVVAGAPDKFDTLKEIADWITNDTTNSTQMVNDIAKLKDALAGYTSSGAVQNAFTTVNGNINTINSVLKGLEGESAATKAIAAAKTTITEANTGLILISSSTDTDGHINYTISANGIASDSDLDALSTKVTTLQGSLDTEVTNRTNADKAINDKIGGSFNSTNTVAKAITAAKTTITTADTGFIRIASSADTDGHINYKFTANDIASAAKLDTLDKAAVKSGKIVSVDNQTITGTVTNNELKFDLSTMVIDCGEY